VLKKAALCRKTTKNDKKQRKMMLGHEKLEKMTKIEKRGEYSTA
jgi:hypothetical protein